MATQISVSIEDRLAIGDAIHAFYRLVDTGRAGETAAFFTADARWTRGPGTPNPGTIEGEEIAAEMTARQAKSEMFTRHLICNLTFEQANGGVRVHYLMTFYRADGGHRDSTPTIVADVHERWREEGGWRIAERTVTPAFLRS